VSNDHYVLPGPQAARRAVVLGQPGPGNPRRRPAVVPMEHSTSAVNWQPINRAEAARRAGPVTRSPTWRTARTPGLLLPEAAVPRRRRREVPLGDAAAPPPADSDAVPDGGPLARQPIARLSYVAGTPADPRPRAAIVFRLASRGGRPSSTRTPPTGSGYRREAFAVVHGLPRSSGVRADCGSGSLGRPFRVRRGDRAGPVLSSPRAGQRLTVLRRGRRPPGHHVLLRHRRRARPRLARRLSRRPARPARHPHRGVRAAARRRAGRPGQRHDRHAVDGPDRRHGPGGRGARVLPEGRPVGPRGGDPAAGGCGLSRRTCRRVSGPEGPGRAARRASSPAPA
jgi:hypothetical protein